MTLPIIIALLLYPGLALTLVLTLVYAFLMAGQAGLANFRLRPALLFGSGDGILNGLSIVLAAAGLVLLPWPLHPLMPGPGSWIWSWALLEAAFVLPLVPALLTGWPPLVRAVIRELQIGVVGRALLWTALAVGLVLGNNWSLAVIPAHLLAILAAAFAFPAAIGWGPFAAETSITPGGSDHGLDRATMELAATARSIRTTALIGGSLVALLPLAVLPPWVGLALLLLAFVLAGVILKQFGSAFPRMPLPYALRMCWLRALPLGLAAVIYLAVMI